MSLNRDVKSANMVDLFRCIRSPRQLKERNSFAASFVSFLIINRKTQNSLRTRRFSLGASIVKRILRHALQDDLGYW